MMYRWITHTLAFASVAGALAAVPAGVAWAQPQGAPATNPDATPARHHKGLLGEALQLDSLSDAQRSAIQALVQQRHDASVPVRQAHAQLLTSLAQQVEQGAIDAQALSPTLNAESAAATSQTAVERDALNRLHALLTPAQRGALVDAIEAGHGHDGGPARAWRGKAHEMAAKLSLSADQKAQIRSNLRAARSGQGADGGGPWHRGAMRQALESFRGDTFDPSALVHVERRGEWAEKLAQAAVPVLNPAQRATLAGDLRARAAHESGS